MNKVQFLHKTDFLFKSYDKKLVFCEKWIASFLAGHKGKNFSFPIRVVNYCEAYCTCFPSSLVQDLTV
jgi:hypothetical protein